MRISNYPTDTLTGGELILATDVSTSTQKYKTVNFSVNTLKTYILGPDGGGNQVVFEGTQPDQYETVLTTIEPTTDNTINLPNISGTIGVFANASYAVGNELITATPAEVNKLDGVTATTTEINYLDITTLGTVEASKVATASSNGDIKFPDNKKIQLGADGDFEISHTGTDTLFKNVKENGTTIFQVNDGGTTRSAIQAGGAGGYVKLYGAGVKKLETTADGITISLPLVCNDDVTLSAAAPKLNIKSSTVAHGMTGLGSTDTLFSVERRSSTTGGALIRGISDDDAIPLQIYGTIGSTNPTDTVAAIELRASKKSGTSHAALADAETVLKVGNLGGDRITVKGNGDTTIAGDLSVKGLRLGNQVTAPTRIDLESAQAITHNDDKGILLFDSPTAGIADGALSAEITFNNSEISTHANVIIQAKTLCVDVIVYGIAAGVCKFKILNKTGGAIANDADIDLIYSVININ